MVLGALLHVVLPLVAAVALLLLLAGRRGRLLLRILVLGDTRRAPLPRSVRRARLWSAVAVLGAALCAVRAAESAATSVPQPWVVWTMASLAALLALGGGIGLVLTGRRRPAVERDGDRPGPRA